MSDQAVSDTAGSTAHGKPRRAGGFARVLVVATAGFVAVTGVALLIFLLVGDTRVDTLGRQYLSQLGHYGSRMESVVEHYQQSLRALGPVAPSYCNPEGPASGKHGRLLRVRSGDFGASCLVSLDELWRGPRQAFAEQNRLGLSGLSHVLLLDGNGEVIDSLRPTGSTRIGAIPQAKTNGSLIMPKPIQVGGDQHVVFVQPLHLDVELVDEEGAPADSPSANVGSSHARARPLLLAGLVPERRMQLSRLGVRPAYFMWAVLMLGFGVLALPLAKLWLLGPKVPYRRIDVVLLLSSAVLTVLLSSVLFLGFLARNRLMQELTDRSANVARELASTMNTRIDDSLEVLSATRNLEPLGQPCPFDEDAQPDANGCRTDARCRVQLKHQEHAHWDILFRTARSGEQTQKWLRGDSCTPFVRLDERPYFTRARSGALELAGPRGADGKPLRATAEVVRSVTSGSLVLVVASPRYDERGNFDGIDAVDTKLGSLGRPVLPPGFQTAVVNRTGEVMLHSNNEAFHGQRLDEALSSPDPLRALLATRLGGSLRTEYLGEPAQVYALPLRGDWSVVVFAPSSHADGLTRQIIAVSLVGFALLVTLELILLLAACWVRTFRTRAPSKRSAQGPPRTRLLQPDAELQESYASIGWLGIVGGIALGITGLFAGARLVTPLLILCLLAGVCATRELKGPSPTKPRVHRFASRIPGPRAFCESSLPRAYTTAWLGMFSLLVLAPAAALFGGAYAVLTDQSVRAEEEYAARHVDSRPAACAASSDEVAVFGYCGIQSEAATKTRTDAPRSWFALCLLNPFPCVLELLPPLKPTMLPDAGRLYRRGMSPVAKQSIEAPSGETPVLRRALTPASLASSRYDWPALFGLCVALAGFALAAILTLLKSLDHLLFLGELAPAAALSQAPLGSRLSPHKPVLVLATNELGQRMAERLHLAPLPLGNDTPPGAPAPCAGWFVCDVLTLSHAELAQLDATLAHPPGPLVLFSASDWLRIPDLKLRQRWASRLRRLGHIEPLPCTLEWTDAQLVTMWSESDEDERRLLAQVALHGYATPHPCNASSLHHLAARGVLDPRTLTIADPAIARFVRTNLPPQTLETLESKAEGDAWHLVRVPLTTGVALLMMCVGVSQPQLAAAGVAVPSLVALLVPLLRQLNGNKA